MKETTLDENQSIYMNTINESANILMELINNILDISKIEAGQFELSIGEIDVFDLANHVIDLFRCQGSSRRSFHCRLDLDSDIPPVLLADSLRLKQVLVNLCGNAIKFTTRRLCSVWRLINCLRSMNIVSDLNFQLKTLVLVSRRRISIRYFVRLFRRIIPFPVNLEALDWVYCLFQKTAFGHDG